MRLLTIAFVLITTNLIAQNEANYWFFGYGSGLNFDSGMPKLIKNGKTSTPEGTSVISDSEGKLLFYTDGVTVWDKKDLIMPNGIDLAGHWSSTQTLIVPNPQNPKLFYIFTTDEAGKSGGLSYTLIDLRLNEGKGDVVKSQKNIRLVTPVSEKITATHHFNGKDFWLVAHKFNSDTIYSYLIDKNGIRLIPVKSSTGITVRHSIGQMKISPNGKKIGYTNWASEGGTFCLGDFDPSNGKIKNVWKIPFEDGYGLEFSLNSNYLYLAASENNFKGIFQYDLNKESLPEFIDSRTTISEGSYASLQLGPDGKIYCASKYEGFLWILNSPNFSAYNRNFTKSVLYLNKINHWGLPNFISSFFLKAKINEIQSCNSDTVKFELTTFNKLDSIRWNFGDFKSFELTLPKKKEFFSHKYKQPGKYAVNVICYYGNRRDTFSKEIFVKDFIKPKLGKDTSFCSNSRIIIGPKNYFSSYRWNTGETDRNINVGKSGIHILHATDFWGCVLTDTISVQKIEMQPILKLSDSILCLNNATLLISSRSTITGDTKKRSLLYFEDMSFTEEANITKHYYVPGKYAIKLIIESTSGCLDSVLKTVSVIQNPLANFDYEIEYPGTSGYILKLKDKSLRCDEWMWHDSANNRSNLKSPDFYYSDSKITLIQLIVNNVQGCADTIEKKIILDYRPTLFIPTAFSPNDDSVNDLFIPFCQESVLAFELSIFNKWGNVIFATNKINDYWNGKTSEGINLQIDVYSYNIKMVDLRGIQSNYKGVIQLVR